jgi:hypothetical protein
MNNSAWALGAVIALRAILVIPSIYTPAHVWARDHHHPVKNCSASSSFNRMGASFGVSVLEPGSCACTASSSTSHTVAEIGASPDIGSSTSSSCSASAASQGLATVTSGTGPSLVSCSSHSP